MLRAFLFVFLLTVFTLKSFAIEPILDQQATAYFNISFDAGYKKKSTREFGLRIDRGLIKPGEIMTISQLNPRPAVFNFGFNSRGLKTFELNGADLTDEYYVYHGAETETETETETEGKPEKKTKSIGEYIDKAPTGVLIGIIIAAVAIADSTSSN